MPRPVTFVKAALATQFRRLLPDPADRAIALERLYEIADDPHRALAEVGAATNIRRTKIMGLLFYLLPVRAANVHDFVVKAISGHATTSMQERYSSVSGEEVRTGLAKVIALAGLTSTAAPANDSEADTPSADEVDAMDVPKAS